MRVNIMRGGHYESIILNSENLNGSWKNLSGFLYDLALLSSDGLATFDTETTRHNVWTHPDCTGGLEATVDCQNY